MSSKRVLLLASMALVLAAFAAPVTAYATTLKDAGKEVSDKEFQISGSYGFSSLGGGISCSTNSNTTVNGQTVRVTSITFITNSCKGSGGLAGCTVTLDSITNLPYSIDIDFIPPKLTTTGPIFHFTLSPSTGKTCSPKTIKLEYASDTFTPDNSKAIKKFTVSGEGAAFIEGVEFEIEAEGSLSVSGTDAGTYEIA